jgi:hypothetical protein
MHELDKQVEIQKVALSKDKRQSVNEALNTAGYM